MKLQSATIKDFKRFTHLTIQNIPPSAHLIMLAGTQWLRQIVVVRRTAHLE